MSDQAHFATGKPPPQQPKGPTPPEPPQAEVKKSRWPGWIWAVPIAALAIVIYLGVRSIAEGGPTVTVTFEKAPGVKANQTKVEYQGSEVGEVQSVKWHKDLRHVDVVLAMNADMEGHLGRGTWYWIAGENISLTNLSDLKSLISGPHVEIAPQSGKTVHHVTGLEQPPVVIKEQGTTYTLHADKLFSLSRGSQIYYLDQKVGEVLDHRMTEGGHGFEIGIFVKTPFDALVHTGSRFWDASAIHFSLGGAGPTVQFQSLPALLQGAIAFETPAGPEAGPLAPKGATFTLYPSKNAAEYVTPPNGVDYLVEFEGTASGLAANAPVKLEGKQIGAVQTTDVQYDGASGNLRTKATIVLDPAQIAISGLPPGGNTPRQRMDRLIGDLVAKGLRAQLTENPPLIGSEQVALRMTARPGEGTLIPGPIPQIPSESSSSGAKQLMTQAGDVLNNLNKIPFGDIGRNIDITTRRLAELSKSPQLTKSLQNLDRSMANIEKVTAEARAQVGPILKELHRVADQAQQTLASAKSILGGMGAGQNQVNTAGLPETLYELGRAAKSLRELANFLDRHPEALIRGRNG